MVTKAVKFKDAAGAEHDAIVLHEYPHCEQTGTADPRAVNLVYASPDASMVGGFGRSLQIVESVKHRDADPVPQVPGQPTVALPGTWYEVGE